MKTELDKILSYLKENNLHVDYILNSEDVKVTVVVLTNGQRMIFNENGEPVYIYE